MMRKPKKPKNAKKMSPKKQYEQFVKIARKLEVDESGEVFEKTFSSITRAKKSILSTSKTD